MYRQLKFILFLFSFFVFPGFFYASELFRFENSRKHNLSICAIFKNEAKYLKEWIEYHQLVGVDHFYLYNNNSTDRFASVLKPYIKKKIVTLINWPDCLSEEDQNSFIWALSTQVSAYENAVRYRAVNETKWMVFVDVDEYLIPTEANSLPEILGKYNEYPAVTLSRVFFDASNIDVVPKRKLLIETVEMIGSPPQNLSRSVEKTIFKPNLCQEVTWPPYKFIFKDDQKPVVLTQHDIRINRYVDRYLGYRGKQRTKFPMDHRVLVEKEKNELLEQGFEIEDQERLIYRFVPELKKRMGFDFIFD